MQLVVVEPTTPLRLAQAAEARDPNPRRRRNRPMTAAWIEAGKVSVRQLAAPRLRPGYARIRMTVAGICNTDLELKAGY